MSIKRNYGEPVQQESAGLAAERLVRLKELFPEVFSEGDKIDADKLRALLGDTLDDRPERYSFAWAGKKEALRLLQMPSRATLEPCPDESVDFENTKNLFIEGENLEVLKLLYKPYFGRVNLIYIDPPYNTGNDFIYPDDYKDPLDIYLKLSGQKDEEGNLLTSKPNVNGRIHSNWLSMMYPRMFLARQLLKEDGLIFISIDDVEVFNLRMLLNEIYGEENFVAQLVWKKAYGGGSKSKHVVGLHEYILCYAKNKEKIGTIDLPPNPKVRKYYKLKDEKFETRGPYRTQPLWTNSMDPRPNLRYPIDWNGKEVRPEKQWQWEESKTKAALENNELVFVEGETGVSVYYKQYLFDEDGNERGAKPYSVLEGPYTQKGTSEIESLFGDGKVFPFPKPSELIKSLLTYCWQNKEAVILDFFAGSCTTAHAVLDLNREDGGSRQFIMVQIPEATGRDTFSTISKIGKERLRRTIAKMTPEKNDESHEDLGFKVFKLAESNYKSWSGVEKAEPQEYLKQVQLFVDPLKDGWESKNVIYEVALKEGYGLNCMVEQVDKVKDNLVYRVIDLEKKQVFYVCLDKLIQLDALASLSLTRDDMLVCRDVALSDESAANLALQCRLKTI